MIKGELLATYRQLERAGIVENYELFKQYLVVERDASDPNRLNTAVPALTMLTSCVSLPWLTSSVFSIQRSLHNGPYRGNLLFQN
ncbi:phage tail sheath protein [Escherichia coli]|nr:phage tail sheath protein [Escherichia coli]